ncbi:hypothetical protein RS130_08380 [Paraglaciecola aquimarina]|uniref:Uncharacterized protein n=1 Tax=Paraglaciecola aquimarina TaxID=1235557 RepID=A0ABU3SVB8_9ALTE|nr:hypothetical protein [Paraglaciecola aquimarina]MDU0353943.1 hypothetical protein [Paraglaciecola aquimarina]
MIKYIYKFSVLILLVAVGIGFLRYYKVNEYAFAIEHGEKLSCSDFNKGITKFKGECWSCPEGFNNWVNKTVSDPANKKHCRKKNNYVAAIPHGKPTGLLKIKCETKDVWFKNSACWTCPNSYKPARIKENKGKAQCKPEAKYSYRAANKIGEKGCPNGAWAGTLSKKCYRCPEGYNRNILKTAFDHDPSDDPKACKGKISLMDSVF